MRDRESRKFVALLSLVAAVALVTSGLSSAEAVDILSRDAWDAKPAITKRTPPIKLVSTGKELVASENVMPLRSDARYLTIHHTGRSPSSKDLKQNLQAFQKQMFDYVIDYGHGKSKHIFLGDIPYHYFIDKEGSIGEGRELTYAAYSNTVYSTPIENHVTVVLDGNFENGVPTNAQIESLTNLLAHLTQVHNIPVSRIGVHSDVARTQCPGKNLKERIPAVKKALVARGIPE